MGGEASGMSGRQKPDVPMRYTIKKQPEHKTRTPHAVKHAAGIT